MTPHQIVQEYFANHYRPVFWPAVDDLKGPQQKDWPHKPYTLADYHEGDRVGLMTGVEVAPGKWLHDVDLDWAPGSLIAQTLLPTTGFVFGRTSKRVSHCFYTLSEPLPTVRFEDIDKTCLIELRGTKRNGEVAFQTMAPPSVWSKAGKQERLTFVSHKEPAHLEAVQLQRQVVIVAIALLFAKRFGHNGFGHDVRLAWAGFLLKAGLTADELVAMGEAMSVYCNNTEVSDVRQVVQSTVMAAAAGDKKVKGIRSLVAVLGHDGKAICARVLEWMGRADDFVRDANSRIVPKHHANIKRAVELLGHELTYDEFADKLLIDNRPMEDREINSMLTRIEIEHHFQPPEQYFERVVKFLAWDHPFHPVKDYLNSLHWDETPRLDTWLRDCAGAEDSPYLRAVSAIVLIAAVRRIRQPGAKYDEMLVLEGAQGVNKSSALRALCPRPEWFSDDLPLNTTSQKMIESTLGKWLIEAAELAGRRKAEIEHLKASLSRQVDGPARLAYAHLPVERARQFIIIGTTNSSAYLVDPTGSRRFWPVTIRSFNVTKILAIRDQLWAEACVRDRAGESIRLPERLWPDAERHQETRREIDPWEAVLRKTILGISPLGDDKRRVATNTLWEALNIPAERRDRSGSVRISEILQRFGFKRTRVRIDGDVQVGFIQEADRLELREDGEREPGEDEEPF